MRVQPLDADLERTDGYAACELAAGYGLTADDWQEDVVIDWLLLDGQGRWLSRTCGLAVPRQNGKNGALEIRELYGMVLLGEKFLHTAHEVKTARKAFKRLKHFFGEHVNDPNAKFPELNALVKEVRSTNGQEAIQLHHRDCPHFAGGGCNCGETGGSVEFVARSKGSGRGFTVDVLVCDEAQDLTDEELEALLPTISSAPLGNPQIILCGTPPNAEKGETGEVFLRVREDGEPYDDDGELLEPLDDFLAWTDFGVADGPLDGLDLTDLALLKACNPALRVGRLLMATIRTEMRRFSRAGLARERFGWWGDRRSKRANDNFSPGKWAACAIVDDEPPAVNAIGVAVSLDGTHTSIGAAGRWDVIPFTARVNVGAVDRRPGTSWAVAEAKRMQDEYGCAVIIDGHGPSKHLVAALEELDVQVTVTTTDQYLDACAALYDLVDSEQVTHMETDDLEAAIAVAGKRGVGDGRWAWGRKASTGDISMLEAATLAAWGVDIEIEAEPSAHYV